MKVKAITKKIDIQEHLKILWQINVKKKTGHNMEKTHTKSIMTQINRKKMLMKFLQDLQMLLQVKLILQHHNNQLQKNLISGVNLKMIGQILKVVILKEEKIYKKKQTLKKKNHKAVEIHLNI